MMYSAYYRTPYIGTRPFGSELYPSQRNKYVVGDEPGIYDERFDASGGKQQSVKSEGAQGKEVPDITHRHFDVFSSVFGPEGSTPMKKAAELVQEMTDRMFFFAQLALEKTAAARVPGTLEFLPGSEPRVRPSLAPDQPVEVYPDLGKGLLRRTFGHLKHRMGLGKTYTQMEMEARKEKEATKPKITEMAPEQVSKVTGRVLATPEDIAAGKSETLPGLKGIHFLPGKTKPLTEEEAKYLREETPSRLRPLLERRIKKPGEALMGRWYDPVKAYGWYAPGALVGKAGRKIIGAIRERPGITGVAAGTLLGGLLGMPFAGAAAGGLAGKGISKAIQYLKGADIAASMRGAPGPGAPTASKEKYVKGLRKALEEKARETAGFKKPPKVDLESPMGRLEKGKKLLEAMKTGKEIPEAESSYVSPSGFVVRPREEQEASIRAAAQEEGLEKHRGKFRAAVSAIAKRHAKEEAGTLPSAKPPGRVLPPATEGAPAAPSAEAFVSEAGPPAGVRVATPPAGAPAAPAGEFKFKSEPGESLAVRAYTRLLQSGTPAEGRAGQLASDLKEILQREETQGAADPLRAKKLAEKYPEFRELFAPPPPRVLAGGPSVTTEVGGTRYTTQLPGGQPEEAPEPYLHFTKGKYKTEVVPPETLSRENREKFTKWMQDIRTNNPDLDFDPTKPADLEALIVHGKGLGAPAPFKKEDLLRRVELSPKEETVLFSQGRFPGGVPGAAAGPEAGKPPRVLARGQRTPAMAPGTPRHEVGSGGMEQLLDDSLNAAGAAPRPSLPMSNKEELLSNPWIARAMPLALNIGGMLGGQIVLEALGMTGFVPQIFGMVGGPMIAEWLFNKYMSRRGGGFEAQRQAYLAGA